MNVNDETTRLLNADPDLTSRGDVPPSKSYSTLYIILSISVTILILDIGSFIAQAPQTAIFEDIICKQYYKSLASVHKLNNEGCKIEPVQSDVALITGWKDTFETIPGILFAIPYGALADHIGRKKVLLLAISGCFLSDVWVRVVCWFPETFPLRAVWLSGVWQLIGGGPVTLTSLFFVMVADCCPAEKRITAFSQIQAAGLLSEFLSVPVGAALMSINPWIPYLSSSAIMIFAICLTMFLIPETFPIATGGQMHDHGNEEASLLLRDIQPSPKALLGRVREWISKSVDGGRWMRRNTSVMLILSCFFVAQLGRQVVGVLLQYASKKFHWTFAKASYLTSLRAGVNLLVLAVFIPALSGFLVRRMKLNLAVKDKRLTQISGALLVAGSTVIFLSATPILLILGQIMFALGFAFEVTARSLLTSLVDLKHLGIVYTGISVMTYGGVIVGGPLLANSFRWGMQRGDFWMGLPFLIAAGLFMLALIAVSIASPHRAEGLETCLGSAGQPDSEEIPP